jgi:5-methylcytosine-specific restriction protein A
MPRDRARYSTAWWQKLRLAVLAREPLCRSCATSGRVTPATELDHIVPVAKGGTDDVLNLQPLCRACHETKTLADVGAAPRGCDARGLPSDGRHWWNAGAAILGSPKHQTTSPGSRRLTPAATTPRRTRPELA